MEMWIIDIVFAAIAVLVSAVVWLRYGRKIGSMVLVCQLLIIVLGRLWIDLGLAAAIVAVSLWFRESRKVRLWCAAILLLFQLFLLGPSFLLSLHPVYRSGYRKADHMVSYRKAFVEGAKAMHEHLERTVVQPLVIYSITFAILMFVPFRKVEADAGRVVKAAP